MRFLIAALAVSAVTGIAVIAGLAGDKQASTIEPVCSDSCDLAAHRAAMQHSVAMNAMSANKMSGMQGMQGMGTPQPSAAPSKPQATPMPSMSSTGSMSEMKMHTAHMTMTPPRPANAADAARANDILQSVRKAIEPYKDYQVAEAAGYKQFLPQLPQEIYHFTSWRNGLANEFSFDPTRPTSLMYKRTTGGFELVGVMYTAPRNSTFDQLNERVPLSVATWHLHVNFCQAPPGVGAGAYFGPNAQFGLAGSITTQDQCSQAGGTFKPAIYNWMVHVWPYETDPTKVWATEEHPGAMNH
ncbi:MAG TPA: hypothetical protein VGW96_02780 [Candidatus Eremiobacteraceae bacterium]|nr:hypothetical protein [Candidatus Eremiobacteraceae bacterium]